MVLQGELVLEEKRRIKVDEEESRQYLSGLETAIANKDRQLQQLEMENESLSADNDRSRQVGSGPDPFKRSELPVRHYLSLIWRRGAFS